MKQRLIQSFGGGIQNEILKGEANGLALSPASPSDVTVVTGYKSAG